MASLGLGWLGEPAIAELIEPAFHFLPESVAQFGSHTISVVIAFTIITALHIVLGELALKVWRFSNQRYCCTLSQTTRTLRLTNSVMSPL